jgi:hypothetical protein
MSSLRAVASALEKGNLTLANILLVHAEIDPLPDEAAATRLAKADRALRRAPGERTRLRRSNPDWADEARQPQGVPEGGQWTSGGADGDLVDTAYRPGQGSMPSPKCLANLYNSRPYGDLMASIAGPESGGRYSEQSGTSTAQGKYQMTRGALKSAGWQDQDGNWTEKAQDYGILSDQDFLNCPAAQEDAMVDYLGYLKGQIETLTVTDPTTGTIKNLADLARSGYTYQGIADQSITITEAGLLAAAHREGQGALERYLQAVISNGGTQGRSLTDNEKAIETKLRTNQDTSSE